MLLLAGCGSSDDDTTGNELQKLGKGEGAGRPDRLGRLRRTGLVETVRTEDRLQGQQQGRRHLRRNGAADAHRPVRRRLGLRQRLGAAGRRRRRRPGQRRPRPQLQDDLQRPQGPALQHLRRRPLRHPARARREPADVEHQRRQTGAHLLGRDPRPAKGGQIQGQDQRLRRPDLHRRRGRLPEGPPARPGDRKPLRAERRAVRSGGRTCSKEQRPNVGEYWSDADQADRCLRQRRQPGRHHLAVPVLRPEGRRQAGGGEPGEPGLPALRGRDGLVGHLDDQLRKPNTPTACTCGWTGSSRRKSTPKWPKYFGEAPAQSLACEHTADKEFCAKYHAENPAFWKRVYYWETPLADCGDGSSDCKDYNDWVQAWTAIKG